MMKLKIENGFLILKDIIVRIVVRLKQNENTTYHEIRTMNRKKTNNHDKDMTLEKMVELTDIPYSTIWGNVVALRPAIKTFFNDQPVQKS